MEINITIKMDRVPLHRGSTNVGLSSANHHNIKLIISENIGLNEDYVVYLFWNSYTISLSKKILD
jgi:hypothetical protein